MFANLRPVSLYALTKKALLLSLISYAGIATVLLMRLNPKPLLIGLDQYGTRVIEAGGDRLLLQEKENFLKHTLSLIYSYDQASFDSRISLAGDLMSESLWSQKKPELSRIGLELKSSELTQTMEVVSLRELDASHFEADLLLQIKKRLAVATVKLRVDLTLQPNLRRAANPYPYEVQSLDENQEL